MEGHVKLIFFKGAQLEDPQKLFNARLKSSTIRAIELHEGNEVDEVGVRGLVCEAVGLNV